MFRSDTSGRGSDPVVEYPARVRGPSRSEPNRAASAHTGRPRRCRSGRFTRPRRQIVGRRAGICGCPARNDVLFQAVLAMLRAMHGDCRGGPSPGRLCPGANPLAILPPLAPSVRDTATSGGPPHPLAARRDPVKKNGDPRHRRALAGRSMEAQAGSPTRGSPQAILQSVFRSTGPRRTWRRPSPVGTLFRPVTSLRRSAGAADAVDPPRPSTGDGACPTVGGDRVPCARGGGGG